MGRCRYPVPFICDKTHIQGGAIKCGTYKGCQTFLSLDYEKPDGELREAYISCPNIAY